ncbi:MAG: YdiU family protein [Gemmatimonadaceae bacterium]|nr:YdiU family protein [Gemmatimonadaceae bacterium]
MALLQFDNQFVQHLPGDPDTTNRRRQVLHACWSAVQPTAVSAPRLLAHSREVAEALGLTAADVEADWFAQVFGGNALLPGMTPYAACYGGHQFGNWAGQLGDGRAISLGEAIGVHGQRLELQLKGAGPTPYSRTADGRAVLRSSIREFLCSEAMHHLGVPTTRALSLVATGDSVVRDMFYNGNPRDEPGAIVCRVAPSFIRFGNFEILASREDISLLTQLVDFTIARDYPHLEGDTSARRAAWFAEVCARTATMIVHWMRVGFVHGVMNTDNMSILGLTIDYGPYGWLDNFDPQWTPNTTDASGRRYRFAQQPAVAQWNLIRLAEALLPVFDSEEPLHAGLDRFAAVYAEEYAQMNRSKFGLVSQQQGDDALIRDGIALLHAAEMDFTHFFRALATLPADGVTPDALVGALGDVFYDQEKRVAQAPAIEAWLSTWRARADLDGTVSDRARRMNAVNPQLVLRNYLAQQAIDLAESGDISMVHQLLDAVRRPYHAAPASFAFGGKRPDWAKQRAGCSMLSCSS